ncbi:hypothetical protein ACQPT2_10240 [Erwinia amylovora]
MLILWQIPQIFYQYKSTIDFALNAARNAIYLRWTTVLIRGTLRG